LVEVSEREAREFLNYATDVLKEKFGFTIDLDKGNGHDAHSPFTANGEPVNIDAQLASLSNAGTDDAGGVTNEAHIHIIPSLLCRGEHPNIVLEYVVNETMTRLGDRVGWSRDKEIKCVTKRIMSAYNNLLLKDHDPATGTIPDWLPGEFHEAWM